MSQSMNYTHVQNDPFVSKRFQPMNAKIPSKDKWANKPQASWLNIGSSAQATQVQVNIDPMKR